ncbi:MAG: NYN domain-containing protein [Paludibacter sp.]
MNLDNKTIAVLIDGDNADVKLIDLILNEAAKYGRVTIKRIYADFTIPQMHAWKDQLNTYAIRPIQKFAYTKGKNSTDSALIIDIMDIMHSKLVDGFCIVSSDSDYTGIAHRVREEGHFVMGIGKSHTPEAFVKACENFIYTEILSSKPKETIKKENKQIKTAPNQNKLQSKTVKLEGPKVIGKISLTNLVTKKPIDIDIVDKAFEMVYSNLTGLALANRLSEALKKVDPTFDIRNYGHTSFRKFLEALAPNFEIVFHEDKTTISLKRGK